jgi:hypothetical protein
MREAMGAQRACLWAKRRRSALTKLLFTLASAADRSGRFPEELSFDSLIFTRYDWQL